MDHHFEYWIHFSDLIGSVHVMSASIGMLVVLVHTNISGKNKKRRKKEAEEMVEEGLGAKEEEQKEKIHTYKRLKEQEEG